MIELTGFYVNGESLIHDTCSQHVANAEDMLSELFRYALEHECPNSEDDDPDHVPGEETPPVTAERLNDNEVLVTYRA